MHVFCLAVLGLGCYVGFSLVAVGRATLSLWSRLLIVASLVAELQAQEVWLQQLWLMGSVVVEYGLSCSRARRTFLDQGIKPMPAGLAARFLSPSTRQA